MAATARERGSVPAATELGLVFVQQPQQLLAGVPVAGGRLQVQGLFDARIVQLGSSLAVSVKDEQFPPVGLNRFAPRVLRAQGLKGLRAGRVAQKDNGDFPRLGELRGRERMTREQGLEGGRAAHDDRHGETIGRGDAPLQPRLDPRQVAFVRFEYDIASLQEAARIAETQRFVQGAQVRHFDLFVSADIDAAQQGDGCGHGSNAVEKFGVDGDALDANNFTFYAKFKFF